MRTATQRLGIGLFGLAGLLACRPDAGKIVPPDPEPPIEAKPRAEVEAPPACGAGLVDHARALALVACLDGEAALAEFDRLLEVDQRDALAGLGLARVGVEFGLEAEARGLLAERVDDNRKTALGGRLGLALLAMREYEETPSDDAFHQAQSQLRNVLAVEGQNPHARALAVVLYLERADIEGGTGAGHSPLAQAICEGQLLDSAALLASCAEEAARRGEPDLARTLFAEAWASEGEHHAAALRHGVFELRVDNLRRARTLLEQALASPWPSIRIAAQTGLGATLERLGDSPSAIEAYRAALELSRMLERPDPPALAYDLGLALVRAGQTKADFDEAERLLEYYARTGEPDSTQRLRVRQAERALASIRAEAEGAEGGRLEQGVDEVVDAGQAADAELAGPE